MSTRESEDLRSFPVGAGVHGSAERSELSPSEELLRLPASAVSPAALPWTTLVGQRISHFRVLAPLGRGGMGVVYRAEDEALRREVALKVLPPTVAEDEERRRRLVREARAAAAVNHPNIATVYEVGEADGRIYIAMELVRGSSITELLAQGQLSVEQAVGIARQILRGLEKAHDAGLVHRDLKPDNVLITTDGVAKVLDFGLAKQRPAQGEGAGPALGEAETESPATADGRLLGTPLYMSPEQARATTIDHRSDLFSFGVVLYQMLTHHRPFTGATTADVLTAILRDDPPPPLQLNPLVPPALSALVERCLAKEPASRYPDCASLSRELDGLFLSGRASNPSASGAHAQVSSIDAAKRSPRGAFRASFAWKVAWKAALGMGVAILGVVAVPRLSQLSQRSPKNATAPPSPAALAPRPTAITDLPRPPSRSPDALAAYAAAMQAFRDGNWGHAEESLRRAIRLDPSMAAAHLHLALILDIQMSTVEGRDSYARAVQERATLGEREQLLLRALEPILSRDPREPAVAAARLREATARYPLDAELWSLLAYAELGDREASLRDAQRASELDPEYADAWQTVGEQLFMLDRSEEALSAFDRCLSISPATADCHGARARIYGRLGRCADMEEDFRRAISSNPRAAVDWYDGRASALFSLERPRETVLEAFTQKWAQIPEQKRRPVELLDRARLAVGAGQFAEAEALALEGVRLIEPDPNAGVHAQYAALRVRLYTETGRPSEAAKVADDYLKRKDVWVGASSTPSYTMLMLRTLLHAGELPREAFLKKRATWLAQAVASGDFGAERRWVAAYVLGITQPEEAEEALTAKAALPSSTLSWETRRQDGAILGQMYQLAGRTDEALSFLRPSNRRCALPGEVPVDFVLGQALEQKGDKDGACAAYASVRERWGNGRPRAVTATMAKAREKALVCPEPSPTSKLGGAASSTRLSN